MSIIEQLSKNGAIVELVQGPDLIKKCAGYCDKYTLSVDKFHNNLQAYLVNREINILTLADVSKFEQFLHGENKKQAGKPPAAASRPLATTTPASNKRKAVPFQASPDEAALKVPNNSEDSVRATDSPQSLVGSPSMNSQDEKNGNSTAGGEAYKNRAKRGESTMIKPLNVELGGRGDFVASDSKPLGMRCRIGADEDDFKNVKDRYKFMYTGLKERARGLDDHLNAIQEQMCAMIKLPMEDLQPVGIPSPDLVWICGRICTDSTGEGKINKQSVMLEGSLRDSHGRRVKLDLKELPGYSLFPGQIVLAEGICASGREVNVKRLVEGSPLETPRTNPERLLEFHHSNIYQGGEPLKVITAAGPFTTSDNLDYAPFVDLMKRIIRDKPDLVVLLGPFVDCSQPLLSSGDMVLKEFDEDDNEIGSHCASYEMVFTEKILRDGINMLFNSEEDYGTVPTNIILIPSLFDAHHECVFPQPPFGDRDEVKPKFTDMKFEESLGVLNINYSKDDDIRKRVHLLPNPCMFRVNEVLFGATSNDTLFALSSDEVNHNTSNRLDRLAAHFLEQQSFCPQFPVAPNSMAQLDFRQSRHWEMSVSPDILIIPSKLTPIVRVVGNGTLVVNPGHLAKGASGGTFAELDIHPVKEKELRDMVLEKKQPIRHEIHRRTRANLIRI